VKYTNDLAPAFDTRSFSAAVSLRCNVLDLAGVWFSESGCHAGAHNPHGDAVGLCQLMPQTLLGLGFVGGWQVFSTLPADEQVPWCARYYRPYTGRMLSPELAYLATFLPAYLTPGYLPKGEELGHETVIAAKGGRLGWAYSANAVFDANGDGRIQLHELGDAIRRNAVGPRWDEIRVRLMLVAGITDAFVPTEVPEHIDLGTVWGAQKALAKLHRPDGSPWYAGPIDGIVGRLTRAAVMSYQAAHGLEQVGYVGPRTKLAITTELAAA
jgi:peptidoglycan hydrolase-like protein with peptidoglycan-binding domain